MKKMRLFYSVLSIIFMFTLVFGSISSLAFDSAPVHLTENDAVYNYNLEQEKFDSKSNTIDNPVSYSLQEPNSLVADQWSYLTQTLSKSTQDWTEIDNSTKDTLPFSHRYRVNNNFNNWENILTPNSGLPYSYVNASIPHSSTWKNNETNDFTLTPSFVPNFNVNVTLYVNDTNTAGDVDLYIYDEFDTLVGSSVQVNSTENVIFKPTDDRNYFFFIDFPASSVITTTNITLEIDQVVDQTKFGMTPGYVPTILYTYTNPNVPKGTSLWTNTISGFPVLRFIPEYPVTISLEVNNVTVDGEVDLYVYNSGGFVAQSTNLLPSFDSVTFTPTSEDIHVIEVRHCRRSFL